MQTAARLPAQAAAELTSAAENAFVSGIHTVAIVGAVLAACASMLVLKFLPRHIAQHEGTPDEPPSEIEERTELLVAEVTASPYS